MKQICTLAIVIVALISAGVWLWQRPSRSMQHFPNGSSIEFYAVTVGTNHIGKWSSALPGSLRRILPTPLARNFNLPILMSVVTPEDRFVVWFRVVLSPDQRGNLLELPAGGYEWSLLDQDGNRVAAADAVNPVIVTQRYRDARRLYYAILPATPEVRHILRRGNAPATLRIQRRVENADGSITYRGPVPPGSGISGAQLHTDGMLKFKISIR